VLLTASAQSLEDPSNHREMIGVMDAIVVLITDMTMVVMTVVKTIMTISVATLRVMAARSRRGDVGGITREAMKLDKRSTCECIITFPSLFAAIVFRAQ
jgi:hypothetical protein